MFRFQLLHNEFQDLSFIHIETLAMNERIRGETRKDTLRDGDDQKGCVLHCRETRKKNEEGCRRNPFWWFGHHIRRR